jgi:hypothetical protein
MSIRVARGDASISLLEAAVPSRLQITGHSPVNLLVIDSQGRRIGFNPAAASPPLPGTPAPNAEQQPSILTEIFGASYSGANSEPQTISIPDPVPGDYAVQATGTGTGPFTITMQTLNVNGAVLGNQESTGIASPGSSNTIPLTLQSDGGVTLKLACATDVTSSVTVVRSGFRFNFATGRLVQSVTLTNAGSSPIQGPISLVLDNVSSNATLFNPAGATSCAAPLGSLYVNAPLDTNSLGPGASATILLQFSDPNRTAISYSIRLLAGTGNR